MHSPQHFDLIPFLLPKISKKSSVMSKLQSFLFILCGPDGTRTRDLRRDRAAF